MTADIPSQTQIVELDELLDISLCVDKLPFCAPGKFMPP